LSLSDYKELDYLKILPDVLRKDEVIEKYRDDEPEFEYDF